MLRVLIPVDGSVPSLRALEWLIDSARQVYREKPEVHLLNVQPSLPGDVAMFINREQIQNYHREEGLKALTAARATLDASGLTYDFHISVGDPAHLIGHFAREQRCNQIVIGARGLGMVGSALLGGVTMKVVHLADVPITIVK
ncbi:MAG: universal stress protein [Gammaproteobacteria bacterium]|nr:universal stress protein [Gammaproteobacteria bacterium]